MICEVSFVILILRLLGFFIPSNVRVEPQVAAKRAPVGSHDLVGCATPSGKSHAKHPN